MFLKRKIGYDTGSNFLRKGFRILNHALLVLIKKNPKLPVNQHVESVQPAPNSCGKKAEGCHTDCY